eukprot:77296-Hanusia_phi.AAC.2
MEEDDEDDEEWDDDKMFAMDKLIAEAFKSKQEERRLAKQSSSMSLILKLRTLELVEIFLSRSPSSPLVLDLLEPLLALAVTGGSDGSAGGESREQRVDFFAKASIVYAERLCKLKSVPQLSSEEEEGKVVSSLKLLFARVGAPHQGELVSAGIFFLLRVVSANRSRTRLVEEAKQQVAGSLEQWRSKKHSNVRPLFFEQLVQRHPWLGWQVAEYLSSSLPACKSDFLAAASIDILLALLRDQQAMAREENLPHACALFAALPAQLTAAVGGDLEEEGSKKKSRLLSSALALAIRLVQVAGKENLDEQEQQQLQSHQRLDQTGTAILAPSSLLSSLSFAASFPFPPSLLPAVLCLLVLTVTAAGGVDGRGGAEGEEEGRQCECADTKKEAEEVSGRRAERGRARDRRRRLEGR